MGTLSLGKIESLPNNWWLSDPPNDPQDVWKVWDRNTWYLWGANSGNYLGIKLGDSLNGGGMAGPHGPTLGRAHPHYVGVITTDSSDLPNNDAVFQELGGYLANGGNIVVPALGGRWALGAGIGASVSHWDIIQAYLLKQVYLLGKAASSVIIPPRTYWPDIRAGHDGETQPIAKLDDLLDISNMLGGGTTTFPAAASSPPAATGTGDQLHPIPQKVQLGNDSYSLVAFYYPDTPAPVDDKYNAGCFGNFHPCTVTLDYPNPSTGQKIVPTPQFQLAEAAFHSLKWWGDDAVRKQFEAALTGNEAYHYAGGLSSADLTYAGLGRLGAMELVLRQKYTENAPFQKALLSTGDAYLLEHNPSTKGSDHFWSDHDELDPQGRIISHGKNMLGRTLMKIRATLPGGQPAPAGTDTDAFVTQIKQFA